MSMTRRKNSRISQGTKFFKPVRCASPLWPRPTHPSRMSVCNREQSAIDLSDVMLANCEKARNSNELRSALQIRSIIDCETGTWCSLNKRRLQNVTIWSTSQSKSSLSGKNCSSRNDRADEAKKGRTLGPAGIASFVRCERELSCERFASEWAARYNVVRPLTDQKGTQDCLSWNWAGTYIRECREDLMSKEKLRRVADVLELWKMFRKWKKRLSCHTEIAFNRLPKKTINRLNTVNKKKKKKEGEEGKKKKNKTV